jgi:anti-sigma B factor antagonist
MDLKSRSSGNVTVLELSGRFDAHGAPRVSEWLAKTSATPQPQVVLNLAGVNFVDSTALATMVQGMKHCRQRDGDLHLCCLQQSVRIIFELTRLDKALNIFPDEDDAIRSFSR